LGLLRKNIKAYLLKNTTTLKKLRMKNGIKKTDENDAMLLAQIPRGAFRMLTAEELELKMRMKSLINKYERIAR
jgi:hypothetical protein